MTRIFRDETKPSKHRFKPTEQNRRTSLQVRLSEVASLYVSKTKHLSHGTVYGMRFRNEINQFETRRDDRRLYLCHLPEGRSDLLGGPKEVFRGLVSPRNCLWILNPIYLESHLVLFFRHSLSWTLLASLTWCYHNLLLPWLSWLSKNCSAVCCILFSH